MLTQAINDYHALLTPDVAQASQEALTRLQREHNLFFGTRPLCSVLRPHFLSAEQYLMLGDVCGLVARTAREVVAYALARPEILDQLALTPGERRLIDLDPGYGELSVSSRLDSFLTTDSSSFQFVEYNAESPAAIAYEDVLSQVFAELPVMQEFGRAYEVSPLPARDRMLQALLDAYREWGGTDEPRIAIVDWKGLPTHSEFLLFQEYFHQHGLTAVICAPEDLRYTGEVLYAGDQPVDLVYKRVLTAEFLNRLGNEAFDHPLTQAYRDGRVCVANNFRAKLLHKKMIFGLLSDPEVTGAAGVPAADAARLARHIPWTRRVRAGRTDYAGDEVDLLPFITANRDRLLLKPNDDYGGAGITIGWETSAEEWAAAVRAASDEPFVVQERVVIAYEDYPAVVDGRLSISQRLVDTDPFLFGPEVQGCLTRLSTVTLLNVTAGGGSTAPTFVVNQR
ncbi:MAG TPA: hypothetical protein VD886_11285 [Herpetosiphonaceae bacterium]|nr:hypothetical protein [Herpetosiphonaceae bacterium]